jgi:hypothetical protein
MANINWQVGGQYFETCNCDYLCPCLSTNLAVQPTKGSCTVAMAFHIDQGMYGNLALNGLNFVVVAYTPGPMGDGNWSVGVVTDERATPEQQTALVSIASGQGGGPMAALGPLVGTFLGVESKPIQFHNGPMTASVSIPGILEQAVEGVPSPVKPGEPLFLDNTGNPVNARLALAKSTGSHLHAFGLNWDDTTGKNNGHFAPFKWQQN